jgi:hypothetical protein
MKQFLKDEHADVKMIGAVVGILITLIIAVLVFYNIAGSIDTTTIDAGLTGSPAANAKADTLDQAATFFQIAPIIAIVVVAVVILGYVGRIG